MITDANTTLTDNRAANPGLTAGLTLENLSFEPRYTAAFGALCTTEEKHERIH